MSRFTPRLRQVLARGATGLVVVSVVLLAYRAYAWPGVTMAVGAAVMWALLHMTRMLTVLKRTAQRPVGSVGSAVMLHARLERGLTLLQLLAFAGALGQRIHSNNPDNPDADIEQYQWTDASNATVLCTLEQGKLTHWELRRP